MRHVVEAFDGQYLLNRTCVLGLDQCTDETPCALHEHWKRFREEMNQAIWNLDLDAAASTLREKRRTAVPED